MEGAPAADAAEARTMKIVMPLRQRLLLFSATTTSGNFVDDVIRWVGTLSLQNKLLDVRVEVASHLQKCSVDDARVRSSGVHPHVYTPGVGEVGSRDEVVFTRDSTFRSNAQLCKSENVQAATQCTHFLLHYCQHEVEAYTSQKLGIHIDASHSRQPLVKGERLVRYEVNAVM